MLTREQLHLVGGDRLPRCPKGVFLEGFVLGSSSSQPHLQVVKLLPKPRVLMPTEVNGIYTRLRRAPPVRVVLMTGHVAPSRSSSPALEE